MSNALALAGVTAVIRDLLDTGLIDHQVTDALGAGVTVSATAPDTIALTGDNRSPQLNLFLHQVTPNPGWRNADLPSRDSQGRRLTNPPLGLDLHYLLTAYGVDDLQAEVLLGYGMHLLHETPVLSRDAIRMALDPPTVNGSILPTTFQALRASTLADQVEQIKITPESLDGEAMSRLWSALQAHYRPTASYLVTVVLIEAERATRSALPVLTRGPIDPTTQRERGVQAHGDLIPPFPEIMELRPPGGQVSARLSDVVQVAGHHLDGTGRAVRLRNQRLNVDLEVAAMPAGGFSTMSFTVPNTTAALPAGPYDVSALVLRPGETDRRSTNDLTLSVAPEITTALPMSVGRDAQGTAVIGITCKPEVRPRQRVSLIVGGREVPADAHAAQTDTLTFRLPKAQTGTFLLRLRVDGVDSSLVNRAVQPPVFFNHRITIS
jgi:Pvc16 N-terminal domain